MNSRTPNGRPQQNRSRQAHKQHTRQALLQASLRLLEDQSLSSLSLREVTREVGIVPTAFYRHFRDMTELGLALVDESFGTLRQMLRTARFEGFGDEDVIRRSVEILVRHVHENRSHFRFIARERYSGVHVVRQAIQREIRLFVSELAMDLVRFPNLSRWSVEDLQIASALLVSAMISTVEAILDAPIDRPEVEKQIVTTTEKQLRLISVGMQHWRSPA